MVRHLSDQSEGVLLVDASNAFNALNRSTAMRNVLSICPVFAPSIINCYREPTDLYIDDETLDSSEGTTQGDPLSMAFYALATIPLIKKLPVSVSQVWYADNATAVGLINSLREWWESLNSLDPGFGYYPNSRKTWLLTRDSL